MSPPRPLTPGTPPPPPPDPVDTACRLFDRAVAAHARGRLTQAARLGRQALRLLVAAVGPDHPDVANVLNTLGQAVAERGDWPRAERLLRRSVRITRQAGGDQATVRIRVQALARLATLYRAQGQYRRAEPLFRRALAVAVKQLGADDLDAALTLSNLAALCQGQGRTAEAEALYRRALAIYGPALGPRHPKVTACREDLDQLLREKGGRHGTASTKQTRA